MNTSLPFEQWAHTTVRTYPFHILTLSIPENHLLFIRVASVNAKGSILSDFHIINRSLLNVHVISSIEKFQCHSDDTNHLFSIQWSIDYESRLYISKYILYYLDTTDKSDDLIRQILISNNAVTITKQQSNDFYQYEMNSSRFDLNYNRYHRLKLHLAVFDQNENQMSLSQPAISCSLRRKSGKTSIDFLMEIICQG